MLFRSLASTPVAMMGNLSVRYCYVDCDVFGGRGAGSCDVGVIFKGWYAGCIEISAGGEHLVTWSTLAVKSVELSGLGASTTYW